MGRLYVCYFDVSKEERFVRLKLRYSSKGISISVSINVPALGSLKLKYFILMPLAIPLAYAVGKNYGLEGDAMHAYMIVNISGVLTGAIFGDHCSPISDTTILSSMGAGCNHIDHVSTQMVYALSVCAVCVLVGYLPVALGLSVWLALPCGFLAIWALVRFVGKKVEA